MSAATTPARRSALTRRHAGEVLRFGITGLAAYGADVAVFNVGILLLGAPSTPSKIVSSFVAIAIAFAGSRWFTWRHRRSDRPWREYGLFLFFSVVAAGIQVLCLVVSRELLGLTSPIADNVSANVIGMGLATVFRFWTFRRFVFRGV